MNTCCDLRDRILDADCVYKDGKFILRTLPGCLPKLFTVRFHASADFTAGNVIVVDDQVYPVVTPQMEQAVSGSFKTDAVVVCEIDRDMKLAFLHTGGTSGTGDDVEFQSSDLVYYIDPLGDDSPNNPGGVDSPFKTLTGAGRAAWQNIVMNPLGRLVFSFNPGTYDLSSAEHLLMTEAIHPLGILFTGTDINDKPLITADHFHIVNGKREFRGLKIQSTNPTINHSVSPQRNAVLDLTDSELICSKSYVHVTLPYCGGCLRINGNLMIDGNGFSVSNILCCFQGTLWAGARISFVNIPSVYGATVYNQSGHMYLSTATFSGAITGKRYEVVSNGIIQTNGAGPDFIPGTIAGTATTGGLYI